MSTRKLSAPGPFRASHLPPGSDYELVDGHPVRCAPTGRDGDGAILDGGSVIRSDPKVRRAGVDPGFAPDDLNVRAPDIAIIPEDGPPGWIRGVPGFAVQYAGVGQDEEKLQEKIAELLARGTRVLWVVRLVGPRRVEIYQPGEPFRVATSGEELHAPEFLANPVPVDALWDAEAADRATLRNLLERFGYRDIDAVREEGRDEGRQQGRQEGHVAAARAILRRVLVSRGIAVDAAGESRIDAEPDTAVLERWVAQAAVATGAAEVFAEG